MPCIGDFWQEIESVRDVNAVSPNLFRQERNWLSGHWLGDFL